MEQVGRWVEDVVHLFADLFVIERNEIKLDLLEAIFNVDEALNTLMTDKMNDSLIDPSESSHNINCLLVLDVHQLIRDLKDFFLVILCISNDELSVGIIHVKVQPETRTENEGILSEINEIKR
jgi:hypothetical protein